jgi:hypothetical protein
MRTVSFGEALPGGTRLTLFSDDRPGRFFTVIKFWIDETSGGALTLKTGVPSYQVEDEEGRTHLYGNTGAVAGYSCPLSRPYTQNLGAVWHPAGWFLDHPGWAEQQHVNLFACVGESRRTRGEMERVYC